MLKLSNMLERAMDNLELRAERVPRRRGPARMPQPVASPAALPPFTAELAAEMAPLYARVKHIITPMEWPHYAPLIDAINRLKRRAMRSSSRTTT